VTLAGWGGLLGLLSGLGVVLVWSRVGAIRRPQLAVRVLPYLRDLPDFARSPGATPAPAGQGLLGPGCAPGPTWSRRCSAVPRRSGVVSSAPGST
jgi:hypothetical protein